MTQLQDWCTEVLLTNKRQTALNLEIPNAANLKAGSYHPDIVL